MPNKRQPRPPVRDDIPGMLLTDAVNQRILDSSFVVVHINIGERDRNLDLAARYEVPLDKGVPALAILGSDGKLLYTQKAGEFEAMRQAVMGDFVAMTK